MFPKQQWSNVYYINKPLNDQKTLKVENQSFQGTLVKLGVLYAINSNMMHGITGISEGMLEDSVKVWKNMYVPVLMNTSVQKKLEYL